MTPLQRLAAALTDAAWLTVLCVTAIPSIVRAGRAKAAEPFHRPADWWIGYYRGPNHHYVCPVPCLVIRWSRRVTSPAEGAAS